MSKTKECVLTNLVVAQFSTSILKTFIRHLIERLRLDTVVALIHQRKRKYDSTLKISMCPYISFYFCGFDNTSIMQRYRRLRRTTYFQMTRSNCRNIVYSLHYIRNRMVLFFTKQLYFLIELTSHRVAIALLGGQPQRPSIFCRFFSLLFIRSIPFVSIYRGSTVTFFGIRLTLFADHWFFKHALFSLSFHWSPIKLRRCQTRSSFIRFGSFSACKFDKGFSS